MNRELLEARKKFRNQKGTIKTGYDNTPLPEGKYTACITESEIKTVTDGDGAKHPAHYIRLTVTMGDHKGKSLFPFKPYLDDLDGIMAVAKNIRTILGDVPGKDNPKTGEFEVDVDRFLAGIEDLATKCVNEVVEITVKNGRTLKDDGTPWQNVYINRALGEDKHGVQEESQEEQPEQKSGDDTLRAKKKVVRRKSV